MTGILYSLATGVALALFYSFNKTVSRAGNPLQIIFWIFATHLPLLAVWAYFTFPWRFDWGYLVPGIGVLILTVTGNLMAIRGLSLSPFGLMMPVMCLSPVFTSLLSIPLLNEWPTSVQWVGIVMAVIGILWLYASPERPFDIVSFWPNFFKERGAPSMALSAFCWSLSAPMDKLALQHSEPAFHATFVFTGLVVFLYIWINARNGFAQSPIPRQFWLPLLATGAAGSAADVLQLFALMNTHAGTVEAIKRIVSQLLGLAIGYFIFKEQMTVPKMIGITIVCIGIPMIVL